MQPCVLKSGVVCAVCGTDIGFVLQEPAAVAWMTTAWVFASSTTTSSSSTTPGLGRASTVRVLVMYFSDSTARDFK
eukprot:1727339-Rhodomonas_salina.3